MLFCGGWWWWVGCSHSCQLSLLLQGLEPTWVSGGFSQAQSLERGSGLGSREAGRQGYSLETGRTLGAWEVIWNQHTEGPGSHRRVCASQWAGSPWGGASSGHALGMGCSPTQPSQCAFPPPPQQGQSQYRAPWGTVCVGQTGKEAEREGRPRWRGVGFSCSQRETGGHHYYCSAGQGGPGMRGARQDL